MPSDNTIPHGGSDNSEQLGLMSIPVEVLIDLIKSVAWKDLLRLRATSNYLLQVTKTRSVWEYAVKDYIATQIHPPRLERPIDLYTSAELEHTFLSWQSAHIGFQTCDGHPIRERTFLTPKPFIFMHLVQGGRWLLLTNSFGGVRYYDLKAKSPVGLDLIEDQVEGLIKLSVMSIDFSSESPFLEFTIAFCFRDDHRRPANSLRVWRVRLIVDELRQAKGLKATRRASIPVRPEVFGISQISLLGPSLAFYAIERDTLRMRVYVINWVQANSHSVTYPWRPLNIIDDLNVYIQLLRGERIFIARPEEICILDHSIFEETTHALPDCNRSPPQCTWIRAAGITQKRISQCFFTAEYAVFFYRGSNGLYSLSIDDGSPGTECTASFLRLMDNIPRTTLHCAYTFTSALLADPTMRIFWLTRYSVRHDQNYHVRLAVPTGKLAPTRNETAIDDESGSIVLANGSGEITVLEYGATALR